MAVSILEHLPSSLIVDIVERVRVCWPEAFHALEQTCCELRHITRSLSRCLCLQSAYSIGDSTLGPEPAAQIVLRELKLRPRVKHVKVEFDIHLRNKAYMVALQAATEDWEWTGATIIWEPRSVFEPPDDVFPLVFLGAASVKSLEILELVNWPCVSVDLLKALASFSQLQTLVVTGRCGVRFPNNNCRNLWALYQTISLPSLTHLDASNLDHEFRTARIFVLPDQQYPNLRFLACNCPEFCKEPEASAFSNAPKQLEVIHLKVSSLSDSRIADLRNLIARCRFLRELRVVGQDSNICSNPVAAPEALESLLKCSSHLEKLHLSSWLVGSTADMELELGQLLETRRLQTS